MLSFTSTALMAQQIDPLSAYNGDTSKYVAANFIAGKNKYINQPLALLLKELGIPVKSYAKGLNERNINVVPGLSLYFSDAAAWHMSRFPKSGELCVYISFVTPVASDAAGALYKQSDGAWLPAEEKYYGEQLVKDIQLIKPMASK